MSKRPCDTLDPIIAPNWLDIGLYSINFYSNDLEENYERMLL